MKKRWLGILLAVLLVCGCLPVSVVARENGSAFTPEADILVKHFLLNGVNVLDGKSYDHSEFSMQDAFNNTEDIFYESLESSSDAKLSIQSNLAAPTWNASDESINLWITSSDMEDDEKDDGSSIPYVVDSSENTWYLRQICWANAMEPDMYYGETSTFGVVLNDDQIYEAATERNKSAYLFSPAKQITTAANDIYYSGPGTVYYTIWYGWTDVAPEKWNEDISGRKTYDVKFDLNQEALEDLGYVANATDNWFLALKYDESYDKYFLDVGKDDPPSLNWVQLNSTNCLNTTVKEWSSFTVGKYPTTGHTTSEEYYGYLVFNKTENQYFQFVGWEGEDGKTYQFNQIVSPTDELAGGDTTITFKAIWEPIELLDQDELKKVDARPPILNADTRNVKDRVLITQWTDTDSNKDGKYKTGETVMLDEERTIYYQMSATVDAALYSIYFSKDGRPCPKDYFMTFTLSLDADDALAFVKDEDGKATLTFNSPLFKVTGTNITGANWSQYPDEDGNSTITFDPKNIPEAEGNVIEVTIKWNETVNNKTDIAPSGTITLSGFAFKLTDGAANKDMKLSTTGNITGSLDLKVPNELNKRFYYQTIRNLLNSNFYGYQEVFGGDSSSATAYVHAMQFTDFVTSDYDLSEDANAVLVPNAAVATYTQYTITANASTGGSISPAGATSVYKGDSPTFTITPNSGYQVADVKVDGKSVGTVASYTFENVTASHTIEATFEKIPTKPTDPPYIPPVDPDEPADPDDTGVSDLLNTEDHIQYLFGYPDGTFGPENNMTRAEVAQMFYNLLLDQDVEITKTFDDVPADAWYAKAVNTLASLDIISGVGDNKFEPERSITRAEFTAMAMKFAVGGEEGENIFSDVDEDDWFYDAVVNSIQYGWIHGYGDGTFRPQNPITRAEVTAIVNNMLGRAADEDFVDEHAEELTPFSDIEKHWAYYHIVEATNDHDYTKPSSGENWTKLN